MTTKDDGGPAFPVAQDEFTTGMTLRAWLTGQALAGLCANPETWASEGIGRWAVEAADAAMDKLGGKGGAE